MSRTCYASSCLKRYLLLIAGILVVFLLFYRYVTIRDYRFKVTSFLMDTIVSIEIRGSKDGEHIANEGMKIFQTLQYKFDPNLESSDVSKINLSSGMGAVEVSDDTLEIIKKAIDLSTISGGAFDITIGALTKIWGFTSGNYRLPDDGEIKKSIKLVDYKSINIFDSKIELRRKGMAIDLGAIAKGYAVDKVYDFLKSKGVREAIIDAGGEIRTIGDRKKWRIGIKDPTNRREVIGILELDSGLAVATSGDYERYFIRNGKRYHHILDPHTGYPASYCRSVTVVSDSATKSDALSTAIFVLGAKKGLELAERLKIGVVIIDSDNNIFVSDNLKKNFLRYEY